MLLDLASRGRSGTCDPSSALHETLNQRLRATPYKAWDCTAGQEMQCDPPPSRCIAAWRSESDLQYRRI